MEEKASECAVEIKENAQEDKGYLWPFSRKRSITYTLDLCISSYRSSVSSNLTPDGRVPYEHNFYKPPVIYAYSLYSSQIQLCGSNELQDGTIHMPKNRRKHCNESIKMKYHR